MRAHLWWCSFYGVSQMYDEMCNVLTITEYNSVEYFHCPENPLCLVYSFLPLTSSDIFTVSIVWPFHNVIMSYSWNYTVFSLLDQRLLLSKMHFGFLYVSCLDSTIFFLVLNSILMSQCTTVYLLIHWLKNILIASKFWQI